MYARFCVLTRLRFRVRGYRSGMALLIGNLNSLLLRVGCVLSISTFGDIRPRGQAAVHGSGVPGSRLHLLKKFRRPGNEVNTHTQQTNNKMNTAKQNKLAISA